MINFVGTAMNTSTKILSLTVTMFAITGLMGFNNQVIADNGAPKGPHYNLNIIGVPKGKTADMTGTNGHTIFVPLSGNCKIWLAPGDYNVADRNCTDANGARFTLPNPDPENDGTTAYSVWARALGKPGGSSETRTCFVDGTDGLTYCSVYSMILVRDIGKSSFRDVSRDLLYVYLDTDADGDADVGVPLFGDATDAYFWDYTNAGLKLAQLRFYPIPTTVPAL